VTGSLDIQQKVVFNSAPEYFKHTQMASIGKLISSYKFGIDVRHFVSLSGKKGKKKNCQYLSIAFGSPFFILLFFI
jgi:hypothetical protein